MSTQQNQTEFYSPFAHIEGRFELCRIHSPSHGSFDTLIVIETTTDEPVTVYVNSANGELFMKDRYPESRCILLRADQLVIHTSADNTVLSGELQCESGPLREATLKFYTESTDSPEEVGYGGPDFSVWGSSWSCTGVDLNIPARVEAEIRLENKTIRIQDKDGESSGIQTRGSYGTIQRRKD